MKPVRGDDGAPRATSGQGALRAVVVEPDQPIFDAVVELANGPAKRTLGFLPTSGFRDRARKATLIAVLRDDAVIGYVLYDLRPRDIKIVQLCVDPGARRSGAARFLLDAVRAGHPDHHRIVLRCRTDYEEASKVWHALEFRPVDSIPGRSLAGSELTIWLHDRGDVDLFQALARDRSLAALDHNVFLDLHVPESERPQGTASRVLLSDWIAEFVELVVTDEVSYEIQRLGDARMKKVQFAQINSYRHIGGGPWQELTATAAKIAPAAGPSDHRHVGMAAAAGATFLLSRDGELLKKAHEVEQAVGVRVIEPAALIVQLDRLQADGPYRLKDLEGTALQTATPTENDHSDLVRALLNHGSGERLGEFRDRVSPLLARAKSHETKIIRGPDGATIAGFTRTTAGDVLDVPVLRVAPGAPAAAVLARQVVFAQRSEAANRRTTAAAVSDRHPSRDVVDALRIEGFEQKDGSWTCPIETGFRQAADLDGVHDAAEAAQYEHDRWPVRVLDAGVATYLVPIRAAFAAALVDPRLAEGTMFKRDQILGLAREHVYYRATRNGRGIHPGARILWYVTGTNQIQARPSVRAVSQVAEVRCGDPRHLFSRFERFGVYTKQQVKEAAGAGGDVMAVRFVDTETLQNPVDLDALRRIWRESGGTFVPSPGPSMIPEHMFVSVYRRSSRHAS